MKCRLEGEAPLYMRAYWRLLYVYRTRRFTALHLHRSFGSEAKGYASLMSGIWGSECRCESCEADKVLSELT